MSRIRLWIFCDISLMNWTGQLYTHRVTGQLLLIPRLNIHARLIKNPEQFSKDFQTISVKINSPVIYTNLAKTIAHNLSGEGQDEYIRAIAPIIKGSGKITQYNGELETYTKGTIGSQAPDLYHTETRN